MKPSANSLSVCVGERDVCIKIEGRANFTSSVDFKTLVNSLWQKGHHHFVLDLTDCMLMDSTFLGVLAGLGLKLTNGDTKNSPEATPIELLNPNARIADLLENLGVAHLFHTVAGRSAEDSQKLVPVETPATNASKAEISRNCLEAHKVLMEINPANVAKFKDVAQFLAEDLKKTEGTGQ
ncbi:MAG TPA: STAS domain-containing protein [Verrucomicrobiae bacterium]|nr:STAS domain-containing protein [Verrucomicrobiae bacterium]